ncbi:hypothetical protein [Bacillus atrophaeus]|uniref:hypothetical protein n=1 Tax=Bacillus atrophaeus TaxID=1452 RepID=UPI002DFBA1EE|nr:hypothetical protein [Bacillus atrophaeus]MED4854856.1 hypothetical protein [Bacillus atrophaeus]
MKKLFGFLFCTMVTLFFFASTASASTFENARISTENSIVSVSSEGEFKPLGLSPPSSGAVVNLNKNILPFNGQATSSTLYTNSHFTGKSKVSIKVTNFSHINLPVKVWESSALLFPTATFTVDPNKTFSGSIPNLDASKKYYLSFSAPSHFTGEVQ